MKVCDVCWSPNELVDVTAIYNDAKSGSRQYIWRSSDICPECLELLTNQDFQKLGQRSHTAILERAGLTHLMPQEATDAS